MKFILKKVSWFENLPTRVLSGETTLSVEYVIVILLMHSHHAEVHWVS